MTLVGTNFQGYADPPATGVAPVPPDPIRILFGDTPALRVWVLSATRAMALVPPHASGTVNVTLSNIDALGSVIGSETCTLPAAFTYRMPDLTVENPITRVTRTLLRLFKMEVLENTSLTTHTDYDGSPSACNITEIATLPAIVLVGPRTNENRFYSSNERKKIQLQDGSWRTLRATFTIDLRFDLIVVSESDVELFALMKECTQCVFRQNDIAMLRDDANPSAGYVAYHFDFDREFEVDGVVDNSNLRQASASIRINGIDLDEEDGLGHEPGESSSVEPSWVPSDYTPAGSVQEPSAVRIGSDTDSGPYQYR